MKYSNNKLHAESLMMSYGYNPFWSEGSIKAPLFQTSTFEFSSAEAGKQFFAKAYGHVDEIAEPDGLIYSRLNNPNLEIVEHRLCLWDKAEECAVFSSGMAAISTTIMEFTKPGDVVLCSLPVYGGTNFFTEHILSKYNIQVIYFTPTDTKDSILEKIDEAGARNKLALIHTETPANPTIQLIDLDMLAEVKAACNCQGEPTIFTVDNTFMGPVWQHPLAHGADIVLYSATKYIGGHSDLIAGAALGSAHLMKRVKGLRTFNGSMASPYTCWLMMRSLETLKIRMEQQAVNAAHIANYLQNHAMVDKLLYLGMLDNERDRDIFKRHFSSTGAMIAFYIKGGEKEAFRFLDSLTLIKLAVSLGSTESLAEHPQTMTHTDMSEELKNQSGVNDQLIRISIGLENAQDLIEDIDHAFNQVSIMASHS